MSNAIEASSSAQRVECLDAALGVLATSGIIGIIRADGHCILAANDAFLSLIGARQESLEASEIRWRDFISPEDEERVAHARQELVDQGSCLPVQITCLQPDGTRVPVVVAATLLSASPVEWVGYIVHLGGSTATPTMERLLATIIERVPAGIIVVDEQGHLVLMNDVGRQISGAAPTMAPAVAEQAEAYALRDPGTGRALSPEETPIARALAGEVVEDFEYVFRPSGAVADTWVRTVAVPLRDTSGQRLGAVAVFEDVTADRASDQAQRDFLSTAAHDLKTPLTSIKGFSQLLERRLARDGVLRPEETSVALQQITRTARRMEDLIGQLLDIARLEAGEGLELAREPVDLVALVRQVVEEHAATSTEHRITVETLEPAMVGNWDRLRLERVVDNLVANSISYTPAGGSVTMTVTRENRDDEEAWGVLRVEDTGIGIPAEDVPHIFERFYRGSNVVEQISGTGIGLAGVQGIVTQHGGQVTVTSVAGAGSTFTVSLPLDPRRDDRNARS